MSWWRRKFIAYIKDEVLVRALTNITGNGNCDRVRVVVGGELDHQRLHENLNKQIDPSDVETPSRPIDGGLVRQAQKRSGR